MNPFNLKWWIKIFLLPTLFILISVPVFAASSDNQPQAWRLNTALGFPGWFKLSLQQDTRYEYLSESFVKGSTDSSKGLSLRTLLKTEVTPGVFQAAVEMEDSRAYLSKETPVNTTIVNAAELLQAYLGFKKVGTFQENDLLDLKAGRLTIDVGSRRLVARNSFRNTINSFSGLDALWVSPDKHQFRLFAVMPVLRRPTETDALRDNGIQIDRELTKTVFWGAFYGTPTLAWDSHFEVYVLGLHEGDEKIQATRNRKLYTIDGRYFRKAKAGEWDWEVEAVYQGGTSRATTNATDTKDMSQRAWFAHAEAGYTIQASWKPRGALQYDYASGDTNGKDDTQDRFDTLFGARRFDFGPTGLYGAFARANISSPGIRLSAVPYKTVEMFTSYRFFGLASARDSWTTANLRDASGNSGDFIGQQVEAQVRWNFLPGNLRLEVGCAHLMRGKFAKDASGGKDTPSTYGYSQLTIFI